MSFATIHNWWLVASSIVVGGVGYFVFSFIRHRSFYRDLPCPPHSMFWGHLKIMGKYTQRLPLGVYTHNIMTQMKLDYDLPDVFYVDLWPAGPCFLICTSPDACVIPTTKNAYDIPGLVADYFKGNVGTNFIEAVNGPFWKHLHQMFAPSLTPSATKRHTGSIIDQAMVLNARFRDLAKENKVVDMRFELGKYPFQVIAIVLFGEKMSSQAYVNANKAVAVQAAINATLNPLLKWRLRKELNQCFRLLETDVMPLIKGRFAHLQQQKVQSIDDSDVTLFDKMLLSQIQSGQQLDSTLMRIILDNVNGLLVAGYGTTTDTSNYIFMLLSAFPHTLKKLREEHVRVFGKELDKTVTMLQENPGVLNELNYTTAVINETLRMFPIGFGVRSPPADMKTVEYKGRHYPMKGHLFGVSGHTMHFDPKYFAEPKEFDPERFLKENAALSRHAFRPFERGLRSCLGQPLAMDEMKILLALIARWFDFELRDHEAVTEPTFSFTDLDTKIGKHAFQTFSFTATPAGPVVTKISLAKQVD